MKRVALCVLGGIIVLAGGRAGAQSSNSGAPRSTQASNDAAAARARAEREERLNDDTQRVRALIGLDPTRIRTVGVWAGPNVPCKLPKREEPYTCRRLLEGPAIILSRVYEGVELIAARGDKALARGERSWWAKSYSEVAPIALSSGEVLYQVSDKTYFGSEGDLVMTIYRP
jgi:hypothetical protein